MQNNKQSAGLLGVSQEEIIRLLRPGVNPDGFGKALLIFVGLILSPVTLLGAIMFYKRGYWRFMMDQQPRLHNLPPIVRVGMVIGAIVVWITIFLIVKLMWSLITWLGGDYLRYNPSYSFVFLLVNTIFTIILLVWFSRWRGGIQKYLAEKSRHGTAPFAKQSELEPYRKQKGFYIGYDTFYNKSGHLLTVAGTRGGKGVNLIMQNLLMPGLFDGNWIVTDPKGELVAVTANAQRRAGRKVVILNPWELFSLSGVAYNPLDILKNERLHLTDDVQMIVEAMVPITNEEDHWTRRARSFISGVLLHLITSQKQEDRNLETLWKWFRLNNEEWLGLLADMLLNEDPNAGDVIRATANEIRSLMTTAEEEYGSVMSCVNRSTDFLKSPALRDNIKSTSDFTSQDLASGNVTLYICFPFDKITTQKEWLRLVVTSLMRSIVRNPSDAETCFLIDEAYGIGRLNEVEMALGGYAGFGIHVWSIFQSLIQIKDLYGENWENFIANCSVRHFFNISDNFGSDYLSTMCGQTSVPEYDDKGEIKGATARPLITSDELRIGSGNVLYTIIDQLPPATIPKVPYYKMNLGGDPNPYIKNKS